MKKINKDVNDSQLFSSENKGHDNNNIALKSTQQCNGTRDKPGGKKGTEPRFYGLEKLVKARKKKFVILAERESNCQTFWRNKIPAIGIPNGISWQKDKDAHNFLGIETIYLLSGQDEDAGNKIKVLSESSTKDRIKILQIINLNELHLWSKKKFKKIIKKAFASAKSLDDYTKEIRKKQRKELYAQAKEIAECENILDMFVEDIKQKGMVGEKSLVKGLYLSLTTRLFDDPINDVIKGQSSTGKSYIVDSVINYFPPEAYFKITAATEKGLIYSKESFKNRFILIYEAAGVDKHFLDYLIRALISDKRIEYVTNKGIITKEGPTGFITTTTSDFLNEENETRYFSFTADESPEQTKAIVLSKAEAAKTGSDKENYDWDNWRAFHKWLAFKRNEYVIPYAVSLGELVNCDATRMRRDITKVLNFIGAHAIIHQRNRKRNTKGFIIANRDDYSAVYKIINKTFSSTEAASYSDKKTVDEVERALKKLKLDSISMTKLAKWLGVDKGTVSRNVESPISKGYLVNKEQKKGVEAKLTLGVPIGKNIKILPSPKTLWKAYAKARKTKKM